MTAIWDYRCMCESCHDYSDRKKPVSTPYPPDQLVEYQDDDGTIVENVEKLAENVIGHRIVKAEVRKLRTNRNSYWGPDSGLALTLDDGTTVALVDSNDCCAYTELEEFLLHPEHVDHIITGVATTDGYTRWHIYADFGDVLEMTVGWSCGNPFYYGYGFDIFVEPTTTEKDAA